MLKSETKNHQTRVLASAVIKKLLRLRYNIQIIGLEIIQTRNDQATLFLPNHPSLIDPVMITTTLSPRFLPRPLADSDQAAKPIAKQAMNLVNPILMPDLTTYGRSHLGSVKAALNEVASSLNENEDILFYPAGRIYRSNKENIGSNSGLSYLLQKAPQTRIILVRISGLWGSCFSKAGGKSPSFASTVPRLLRYLLVNGIFFGPKRKVTIEFIEDNSLAKLNNRKDVNQYLEDFYNGVDTGLSSVPYYWFQKEKGGYSPEPASI